MKNAFITFYNVYKDGTVELSNGFTFINHLVEGEHFFIRKDFNKDELIDKLSRYDRIYVTIIFLEQLISLLEIIDNRWTLGGRFFTNISREHWIKFVSPDLVYTSTFESYLKQPTSSILNSYWDKWINNPPCLKYSAICNSDCYWKKCKFCKITYKEKTNNITRDIIKVYNQLPEYNFVSVATLNSGALQPRIFVDLISEVQRNPKKNVLLRLWIRAEESIIDIFNQSTNLSGFVFNFGLETFSQKAADILGRGLKIKNILQMMKTSIDKGAYVNVTYMSRLPFIDDEIFLESIENIQWLRKNIKPESKIYFFDSYNIEWPSEEVAKEFGEYDVILRDNNGFMRHDKKIISRLTENQNNMCSRIMCELNGYKIVNEKDYLSK